MHENVVYLYTYQPTMFDILIQYLVTIVVIVTFILTMFYGFSKKKK